MMERTCERGCTADSCPPGNYYVTCQDGPDWWLMAGPYRTHAEALARVDRALRIADDIDGRAWFMAWGTARLPDDYSKPGRLNALKLI